MNSYTTFGSPIFNQYATTVKVVAGHTTIGAMADAGASFEEIAVAVERGECIAHEETLTYSIIDMFGNIYDATMGDNADSIGLLPSGSVLCVDELLASGRIIYKWVYPAVIVMHTADDMGNTQAYLHNPLKVKIGRRTISVRPGAVIYNRGKAKIK